METADSIIQRFNAIRWHDSKLLGLCLRRVETEDRVTISLKLQGGSNVLEPAEMTFTECVYLEAGLYLDAKAMCSDDISDAECSASTDWKDAVSHPGPMDPIQGGREFERFLDFRITMCPPGGRIHILASGFFMEPGSG